ncbi:hypothetical protein MBM_01258 [Drepanopeziza brunnea f. sp. 'multigermtubi' MB_m1]|uniref:Uncharacterized protein n=1 Tax=Marssonina brunnea f. sp. multigermtubi (strain MB_m1) TaxID=1072389 RepID=K1X609_MARBU|nr:uncharacterized protein MBM_01258 [Drepanopeziza brunnea f. sp. 'multigermtubi' MB_m1]EKD20576.1 hypothetical protein MBM_01258 [Drepanopeziza brunnea f. sp. 'multigermtubi' MB_m1]
MGPHGVLSPPYGGTYGGTVVLNAELVDKTFTTFLFLVKKLSIKVEKLKLSVKVKKLKLSVEVKVKKLSVEVEVEKLNVKVKVEKLNRK